ncbi:MAG TPA: hypothetical protein VGO51_17990, partial [Burkholderiaceae bacterium]|nr:hypothetical protein [Burkholderiaceae bacterium]
KTPQSFAAVLCIYTRAVALILRVINWDCGPAQDLLQEMALAEPDVLPEAARRPAWGWVRDA